MRSNEQAVYDRLERLGIWYSTRRHPAVFTMEQCQPVGAEIGAAHCKNLFLSDRAGTRFYLLLTTEDKAFKTKDVSRQLGVSRLSFGKPDRLLELLGVEGGAVSPLGLLFDAERRVELLVDRDLLGWRDICLHPCINTATLVMRTADLLGALLDSTGHSYTLVDMAAAPDQ